MENFNPFSLSGKTVMVTGASSGIGRSIAVECSKAGADVVITGRNAERLNQTLAMMQGGGHAVVEAELSDTAQLDRLADTAPELDGVVFCAGIVKTMPVKNITDSAVEEIFDANIMSSIRLSKRLLKKKKLQKGASVVFISSVSTFNVKVGNSLYSATKGAVNSFAKAMALEVAPQRIRVNCIQPGFVRTGLLGNGAITEEQLQEYDAKHPLGFGLPEDVAYACVYFLSDASRWVTGSVFTIDGGLTLR